ALLPSALDGFRLIRTECYPLMGRTPGRRQVAHPYNAFVPDQLTLSADGEAVECRRPENVDVTIWPKQPQGQREKRYKVERPVVIGDPAESFLPPPAFPVHAVGRVCQHEDRKSTR